MSTSISSSFIFQPYWLFERSVRAALISLCSSARMSQPDYDSAQHLDSFRSGPSSWSTQSSDVQLQNRTAANYAFLLPSYFPSASSPSRYSNDYESMLRSTSADQRKERAPRAQLVGACYSSLPLCLPVESDSNLLCCASYRDPSNWFHSFVSFETPQDALLNFSFVTRSSFSGLRTTARLIASSTFSSSQR